MRNEEIKSCKCGSDDVKLCEDGVIGFDVYAVCCFRCMFCTETHVNEDDAKEEWNRR